MAKINVLLKSVFDDGKSLKQPGEIISLDAEQANKLAALGMVEITEKGKSKTTKTPETDDANPEPKSQGLDNPDDDPLRKEE